MVNYLADKKILALVFAVLVLAAYWLFFRGEVVEEIPPLNLALFWEDSGCSVDLSNALVYSVFIMRDDNGSVANFECQLGPMYQSINNTQPRRVIKDCNRETAGAIDLVLRGQNKTPVPYAIFYSTIPKRFNNYTYEVLACKPYDGKYFLVAIVSYAGAAY